MKLTRQSSLLLLSAMFLAGCGGAPAAPSTSSTVLPPSNSGAAASSAAGVEESPRVALANNYIEDNKDSVDNSRKPTFHCSPLIGWMNDPNGFSEYNGKYHLFYQYYPYDSVWGAMHWDHQTTTDFIKWNHEKVALAPDQEYDRDGCFSGTAITEGDTHYLVYTSVIPGAQNQSVAYSTDGIIYQKNPEKNPILTGADLPEGFSNADFRDPSIFKKDDTYYLFAGNADKKGNKQVICFSSKSITEGWKYLGVTYSRTNIMGIFECPDYLSLGGKDILIASPQQIAKTHEYEYQNPDSCVYKIGTFNPRTGRLLYQGTDVLEEFDKGFSFYAPQTMTTSDGRAILTAWMKSWAETNITKPDGWAGSTVLPRELTLKDDHIYQAPVRELANYFTSTVKYDEIVLEGESLDMEELAGRSSSITLEIDVSEASKAGIEVFKKGTESTKIYYDTEERVVVFDRNRCGSLLTGSRKAKVEPINGKIKLQIILDVSCCEVFINDGYYTMTGNIFADDDYDDVTLYAEGKATFSNVVFHEIEVA